VNAGDRLQSTVCEAQVIVVRAPSGEVDLRCGGAPMEPVGEAVTSGIIDPDQAGGTALGKRYSDEASGLELLCTKAGAGTLTIDGRPVPLKDAKPLPSSD
jgi:hypothetical protein